MNGGENESGWQTNEQGVATEKRSRAMTAASKELSRVKHLVSVHRESQPDMLVRRTRTCPAVWHGVNKTSTLVPPNCSTSSFFTLWVRPGTVSSFVRAHLCSSAKEGKQGRGRPEITYFYHLHHRQACLLKGTSAASHYHQHDH